MFCLFGMEIYPFNRVIILYYNGGRRYLSTKDIYLKRGIVINMVQMFVEFSFLSIVIFS